MESDGFRVNVERCLDGGYGVLAERRGNHCRLVRRTCRNLWCCHKLLRSGGRRFREAEKAEGVPPRGRKGRRSVGLGDVLRSSFVRLLGILGVAAVISAGCGSRAEEQQEAGEGSGPLDAEREVLTQPGTPITAPSGAIRHARRAADAANSRAGEQQSMMDSLFGD